MLEHENEYNLVFTVPQQTIDRLETLTKISGIEGGKESVGSLLIYALRLYQDLLRFQLDGKTVAFLDSKQLKLLVQKNDAPIWWTSFIESGQEDLATEYFKEEDPSKTGDNDNEKEKEKFSLSQKVVDDISKLLEDFS